MRMLGDWGRTHFSAHGTTLLRFLQRGEERCLGQKHKVLDLWGESKMVTSGFDEGHLLKATMVRGPDPAAKSWFLTLIILNKSLAAAAPIANASRGRIICQKWGEAKGRAELR